MRASPGVLRGLMPAAVLVAAGAMAAKAVGFGKELLIANKLGAGVDLDVFLMACLFPAFLIGLLSGSIQSAVVPEYVSCKTREGDQSARTLVAQGASVTLLLLLLLLLLMFPVSLAVIPAIASGFSASAQSRVVELLLWLMPWLVLVCLTAYWAGILNAEGRFTLVAFTPGLTPLCVMLALVFLDGIGGAGRLVVGTLTGAAMEMTLIGMALHSRGFRLLGRVPAWTDRWRRMGGQFLAMAGAGSLMGLTAFVDQAFAARLPTGSVSVLSYGTKLTGVVSALVVVVISTLALPAMSRMAAAHEWRNMERTFFRASAMLCVVTVLVAAVLSGAARPIIEALFMHGAFSEVAAAGAAHVQAYHAWHIPFYALGTVALRTLIALRMSHVAVIGSAINLCVDIVVNVVAAPLLGVAGVALATTIVYLVSFAFLATIAVGELRKRSAMA